MTFPSSNLGPDKAAGSVVTPRSSLSRWQVFGLWVGLSLVGVFSFHCIGVLVFSALGLSPGGSNWPLALVLFFFLLVAGFFTSVQGVRSPRKLRWFCQAMSAVSSGALLGIFVGAELTGQDTVGAVVGLVAGSGLLLLCVWVGERSCFRFVRCFLGSAIALIGSLCAYAITFVLSAWFWFALTTQHVGLAVVFAGATGLG